MGHGYIEVSGDLLSCKLTLACFTSPAYFIEALRRILKLPQEFSVVSFTAANGQYFMLSVVSDLINRDEDINELTVHFDRIVCKNDHNLHDTDVVTKITYADGEVIWESKPTHNQANHDNSNP